MQVASILKNVVEKLMYVAFPQPCVCCNHILANNEYILCTFCKNELPLTDYHLNDANELKKRFYGRVNLKYALAYLKLTKKGTVQNIIHHLKYEGAKEIGKAMGEWYACLLASDGLVQEFDLILPVPLHSSRQKKRGYNQSDYFAQGLSEVMNLPWSNSLIARVQANQSQTTKNRYARWKNVEDIFSVIDKNAIVGKHILLVDDVITTGSTIEACATTLEDKGISSISVAAIAATSQ